MAQRRRVTDRLPELVSRGNLDDRLAILDQRVSGLQALANERWDGHKTQHEDLARNLREYKAENNEWRGSLTDLRQDFLQKSEATAETRRLESLINTLDIRLDTVVSQVQSINDRSVATRGVFSDTRNVLATAGIIFGAVASALLIFNRLNP